MDRTPQKPGRAGADRPASSPREDRLKAALKANMARRKAQARARADETAPGRDHEADDGTTRDT